MRTNLRQKKPGGCKCQPHRCRGRSTGRSRGGRGRNRGSDRPESTARSPLGPQPGDGDDWKDDLGEWPGKQELLVPLLPPPSLLESAENAEARSPDLQQTYLDEEGNCEDDNEMIRWNRPSSSWLWAAFNHDTSALPASSSSGYPSFLWLAKPSSSFNGWSCCPDVSDGNASSAQTRKE